MDHSYMASFVQNSDSSITIRTPDGQVLIFDPVGGSYISRFNNVYSTLQSPFLRRLCPDNKESGLVPLLLRPTDGRSRIATATRSSSHIRMNLTVITTPWAPVRGLRRSCGPDHPNSWPCWPSLQYQYTGRQPVAFTDANGGTFTYTYDGAHEMLTAVDSFFFRWATHS